MKKQAINRAYNFPDADLYSQARERITYIKRDAKEFEEYAFGLSKVVAFETKEQLKTAIRSIMTRVASKYNVRSGHYRKFGTLKMNEMNDPKLHLCGRRVVRVSNKMLPFLVETGLQQKHIDKVQETAAAFENSIHIQQDKISDRDIAVELRTDTGNEVYRQLVLICNIGKDIWAEKNSSKYESYCIYESNNDQKIARKKRLKKDAEQLNSDVD
jgi:hypothetical protein